MSTTVVANFARLKVGVFEIVNSAFWAKCIFNNVGRDYFVWLTGSETSKIGMVSVNQLFDLYIAEILYEQGLMNL